MNVESHNGSIWFKEIFNAKNIAIIGVSEDPTKLGYRVTQIFLKSDCNILPVHPQAKEILGLKVYTSVREIPTNVDLAVILVPPKIVPQIIQECGVKGIKYVVITTEGFGESGEEGIKLKNEIKKLFKTYNIHAIGPNTMGVVDVHKRFSTSFVDHSMLRPGNVSISAQTGILTGALLHYINLTKNIKICKSIDLGNKIELDHADVLEYLAEDEKTEVIMMYIEGISDGKKFLNSLKKTIKKKPVIILKGGATEATQRIVKSHTGSIAGSIEVFNNIVKQAGAIRAHTYEEMIELAKGFSYMPLPKGNKFAIITGSGGASVTTADTGVRYGLKLAKFSETTTEKLMEIVQNSEKIRNPVDIWPAGLNQGLCEIYSKTISILDQDENVDAIIPLVFRVKDFLWDPKDVVKVCMECKKPVFVAVQGHDVQGTRNEFEKNNIPTFSFGEKAAFVLSQMWKYKKTLEILKN